MISSCLMFFVCCSCERFILFGFVFVASKLCDCICSACFSCLQYVNLDTVYSKQILHHISSGCYCCLVLFVGFMSFIIFYFFLLFFHPVTILGVGHDILFVKVQNHILRFNTSPFWKFQCSSLTLTLYFLLGMKFHTDCRETCLFRTQIKCSHG